MVCGYLNSAALEKTQEFSHSKHTQSFNLAFIAAKIQNDRPTICQLYEIITVSRWEFLYTL